MSSFLKFIVALLALVASCEAGARDDGYRRANRYFARLKDVSSPAEYVIAAKRAIQKLQKPSCLPDILVGNRDYLNALENIIDLAPIMEDPQCTVSEFHDLMQVIEYSDRGHRYIETETETETGAGAVTEIETEIEAEAEAEAEANPVPEGEKKVVLSPIDKIVYEASKKRADKCREVWPRKFATAYANLGEDVKGRAEFKKKSLEKRENMNNRQYIEFLIDYNFKNDLLRVSNVYESIIVSSEGDKEKCQFDLMYKRYFEKPCEEYAERLNSPILLQARFDAKMYPGKTGFVIHDSDQENEPLIQFYQSLAYGRACDHSMNEYFVKEVRQLWYNFQLRNNTDCVKRLKKVTRRTSMRNVGSLSPTSIHRSGSSRNQSFLSRAIN